MFETLSFGDVVRLMGRVAGETFPQQATVLGAYAGMLIIMIGGFSLADRSSVFAMIALIASCVFFAFMSTGPSVLGALMAPRAAQLVSGELDGSAAGIPWRRLPSILWASFVLSLLVSFMMQLFLVPGFLVLAALWSWPMVAACEPGVAGFSRAQALVKGRMGKVMTWFLGLALCLIIPFVFSLMLAAYAVSSSERSMALSLVLGLLAALLAGSCIVIQSSFWATIYAVLRHDESRDDMSELLRAFE